MKPLFTRVILALGLGVLSGCVATLEPCSATQFEEATEVVYTIDGRPAFAGQALMIQSCGGGSFCHSDGIDERDRLGVPAGLNFDLRLASYTADFNDAAVDRLRTDLTRTFDMRYAILTHVNAGTMPPGDAGDAVLESSPTYYRVAADGSADVALPAITSEEGRRILRNWFACETPVVERTIGQPGRSQQIRVGWTERAAEPRAIQSTWGDIYGVIIQSSCASSLCHGNAQAASLDLSTAERAYDALVGTGIQGRACSDVNTARVVAGDADNSLLVHKIEGRDIEGAPVCGDPMPRDRRLPAQWIAAVRQWIANGAPQE